MKKETLQFLKDIKKNNNRDWFTANKNKFISANENFIEFVQELIDEVSRFDKTVAGLNAINSVFRIYRDTLLGKGKGCGIAGYYFHLEPANAFLAGGIHMTEPANLKAIREEISSNGKTFLKIINDKNFKENFKIEGEKLTRVPPGFDKDDPMGEYLKYKELMVHHSVADKEILSGNFISYCTKVFKAMVPFNKFVNEPVMALI